MKILLCTESYYFIAIDCNYSEIINKTNTLPSYLTFFLKKSQCWLNEKYEEKINTLKILPPPIVLKTQDLKALKIFFSFALF